jgi:hypothetical protein
MAFWTAARVMPRRERLALHCLKLSGFETYVPRIKDRRIIRGRKVNEIAPLFPSYIFILIELQWHAARFALGVASLIMDGERPARVPDNVIAELHPQRRHQAATTTAADRAVLHRRRAAHPLWSVHRTARALCRDGAT